MRKTQLARALTSVMNQTFPVDQIVVNVDYERLGASGNRNKAWKAATSDWIAFLDDDDELDSNHIQVLVDHAAKTGADIVFPWHRIVVDGTKDGPDILGSRGIPDEDIVPELSKRNFIPINVLVRRAALEAVGGFPEPLSESWPHADCEDWGCWLRLADAGFKFSHTPEITWTWHHWGWGTPQNPGNTSGKADRW